MVREVSPSVFHISKVWKIDWAFQDWEIALGKRNTDNEYTDRTGNILELWLLGNQRWHYGNQEFQKSSWDEHYLKSWIL